MSKILKNAAKGAKQPGRKQTASTLGAGKDNVVHSTTDGHHVLVAQALFSMKSFDPQKDLPLIYCDKYNMSMGGIELLHNFDTKKYAKLAEILNETFLDTKFARFEPNSDGHTSRKIKFLAPNRPVKDTELLMFHSRDYLKSVNESKASVARITEVWALNLVPLSMVQSRVLEPLRWQVAGTVFGLHLALQHGWAVNLGGGFHQAATDRGDTFCIYSDVGVAINYMWRKHPTQKFMVVDLDAHQATGFARYLGKVPATQRKKLYLLDMYNKGVQPPDPEADKHTDQRIELANFASDDTYLKRLETGLAEAFAQFKPSLVVYIAGQDVLKNDQLGLMNLTDDAMKRRDELVFEWALRKARCPCLMLLGGGYLTRGPRVVADSIRRMFAKGLIWAGTKRMVRGSITRYVQTGADGKTLDATVDESLSNSRPAKGAMRSQIQQTAVAAPAPASPKEQQQPPKDQQQHSLINKSEPTASANADFPKSQYPAKEPKAKDIVPIKAAKNAPLGFKKLG